MEYSDMAFESCFNDSWLEDSFPEDIWEEDFESLEDYFTEEMFTWKSGPPPASKAAIDALKSVDDSEGKCVVCLEDWGIGEKVKEMPCRHRFHCDCIDKWLSVHGSCPVCRHQMPEDVCTHDETPLDVWRNESETPWPVWRHEMLAPDELWVECFSIYPLLSWEENYVVFPVYPLMSREEEYQMVFSANPWMRDFVSGEAYSCLADFCTEKPWFKARTDPFKRVVGLERGGIGEKVVKGMTCPVCKHEMPVDEDGSAKKINNSDRNRLGNLWPSFLLSVGEDEQG